MVLCNILLANLSTRGFDGGTGQWIRSYLDANIEKGAVRNSVESSVLQGSILGPFLFSVFTDDRVGLSTPATFLPMTPS